MKHILLTILLALSSTIHAQNLGTRLKEWAANYTRSDANIKPSTLKSCTVNDKEEWIRIVFGGGFQEQHFTPAVVKNIYEQIEELLPRKQRNYDLTIETDGRAIEDLVPIFFRDDKDDDTRVLQRTYRGEPWVKNLSRPYTAHLGLEGNHIAVWQSHGRYYKPEKGEWIWQRPRLFGTTEDLFHKPSSFPISFPCCKMLVLWYLRLANVTTNETKS